MNFILIDAQVGDAVFFLFIRVLLAVGVGYLGKNRKIGFGWAFFFSLISVLIGLIIVLCSPKSDRINFTDLNKSEMV